MSGEPFDSQGEARDALRTAVTSYGDRVLNDPRMLGNLVTDLLPDSPRERSLLVTAAEAGLAAELTQHVRQQHLDADTAVSLVARALTERRSIDIAASTWVTTEYAQALGFQVRSTPAAGYADDDESPATATVRRPRSSSPAPFPVPPAAGSQPTPQQPPVQSPGVPPLSPQPPQSPGTAPLFPPSQESPGAPQYPGVSQPERGYQPTVFQPPPAQPWGQQQPSQPPAGFQQSQPPAGFQQQPSSQPPAGFQQQPSSQPPAGFQQQTSQPQSPYQQPAGYQPPSYLQQGPSSPTTPQSPFQQPAGYQSPYQAPGGGPGQPPGWQGMAQPAIVKGGGSRKGLLFGGIGAVVVIAVVIAVVLATSSSGNKPTPVASSSSPHPSPTATSATPTATPTLADDITPLRRLLPTDINDFETECAAQTASELPFKATGLISALKCTDPGLKNGVVYAFQVDSAHDYEATWKAFNSWLGFSPSIAGTKCPPSGSGATSSGITGWHSGRFPSHGGQEVECQYVNTDSSDRTTWQPDYVWSYPTEWAFIDAQAAPGSSFSALQTWWANT